MKTREEPSFEICLRNLEQAVERLEGGELPLEEALTCFEQGVKAAAGCQQALQAVEQRVELLLKDQEDNFRIEKFNRE